MTGACQVRTQHRSHSWLGGQELIIPLKGLKRCFHPVTIVDEHLAQECQGGGRQHMARSSSAAGLCSNFSCRTVLILLNSLLQVALVDILAKV